jgi:hypothetical protein
MLTHMGVEIDDTIHKRREKQHDQRARAVLDGELARLGRLHDERLNKDAVEVILDALLDSSEPILDGNS